MRRASPPGTAISPEAFGTQLYEALFHGQVGTLYERSRGSLESDRSRGLRVKIKLDPELEDFADLEALPWELLRRGETDDYLGLSRRSPIVRYLDVPQPVHPIPLPKRLRVLAVVSSPKGLDPLDLDEERRLLESTLGSLRSIELVFLDRATVKELRRALARQTFHVLHFMGHGGFDAERGEGVVYFEQENGEPLALSGRELARKLRDLGSLGLVFLNACDTARSPAGANSNRFAGVASALVLAGLPAVVAMQRPISDTAAIAFSDAFYRHLADGRSVDEALTEGRQEIHSAAPTQVEWATPALFVRVPDGTVFQRLPAVPHRVRWAVAVLLLMLTAFIAPPTRRWLLGSDVHAVELGTVVATSVDGLEGRIERVEITTDGRMRLYFDFSNGTNDTQTLGLDLERTYLADELGNPYRVLASGAAVESKVHVHELASGQHLRQWLEFEAPRDGAQSLSVSLAAPEDTPQFRFTEMDLGEYPRHLSPTSPVRMPPEGYRIHDLGTDLQSTVESLGARLAGVDLAEGQAMRFNMELMNGAARDLGVAFDYAAIELVDNFGNVYRPRKWGVYGDVGKYFRGPVLRRALRQDRWLEFPWPESGAAGFRLRLVTTTNSDVSFLRARVDFEPGTFGVKPPDPVPRSVPPAPVPPVDKPAPKVPTRVRPTVPESSPPKKTFVLEAGQKELETTLPGLRCKLVAIDQLASGRLRWHFEFLNVGGSTMVIGWDYRATTLFDSDGDSFRLQRTSLVREPYRDYLLKVSLSPGGSLKQWFEFAGEVSEEEKLYLSLAGHVSTYRYRTFEVSLSEVLGNRTGGP
ncbi:MAG: CHAT domain-containing protein [Acidobacteriota bacterium]